MEKRAAVSSNQTYPYPIEDVFRVIVESIIKQMRANGKKHNLNYTNPLGKTSDYVIVRGKREIPVHFEITKFTRPYHFAYVIAYNNTITEQEWMLKDYDSCTTNVTYTERAKNTSVLNNFLLFLNKKQFKRTAFEYFYRIDRILEEMTLNRNPTSMNIAHLRTIANMKKIKIPKNANKAQIIKLIKTHKTYYKQNKKAS